MKKWQKKKALTPLFYLASIVFLPWCISLSFQKSLESWITNWWNTRQSEAFLNDIEENSILEKFKELKELLLLEEMSKELKMRFCALGSKQSCFFEHEESNGLSIPQQGMNRENFELVQMIFFSNAAK